MNPGAHSHLKRKTTNVKRKKNGEQKEKIKWVNKYRNGRHNEHSHLRTYSYYIIRIRVVNTHIYMNYTRRTHLTHLTPHPVARSAGAQNVFSV